MQLSRRNCYPQLSIHNLICYWAEGIRPASRTRKTGQISPKAWKKQETEKYPVLKDNTKEDMAGPDIKNTFMNVKSLIYFN